MAEGRRRKDPTSSTLAGHTNTLVKAEQAHTTVSLQVLTQPLWLEVHCPYSGFPDSFGDVLILLLPDF